MGGEQPREPNHHLEQRSRLRRQRRGHLPARRGDRPVLEPHPAAGPWDCALHGPSFEGFESLRTHITRDRKHPRPVRAGRRPGAGRSSEAGEPHRSHATPVRHSVRRVGARQLTQQGAAPRRHLVRRGTRDAHRPQSPQPGLPGPRGVPGMRQAASFLHRKPDRVRRPQSQTLRSRRDAPQGARATHGPLPRQLRRAHDTARAGAWGIRGRDVPARPDTYPGRVT